MSLILECYVIESASWVNVKTPFDAVVKWHVLDETIFKEKPEKFKQKILYLKCISKQGEMEQPCEA